MRSVEAIRDCAVQTPVDFDSLDTARLEVMAAAGQELVEIHRILTKTGDNVVGELLRGQGTFYEWDHYPPGDVYDRETHSQFYYHAHVVDQRFPGEHGHFHTFLRAKGMPEGVEPVALPDYAPPKDVNDDLSHLAAIAMTGDGLPFRLFTTNRWVTAETWYEAGQVVRMLDRFHIDHARPSWPTNRWVTAMLRLFRPQIVMLLEQRDRSVGAWRRDHPDVENVYEDRDLEITSYADISIEEQARAVGQALLART